jgi:hypothetical protein
VLNNELGFAFFLYDSVQSESRIFPVILFHRVGEDNKNMGKILIKK